MKVTLVNYTPQPIETIMWAFMNMHRPIPHSIEEFNQEMIEKHGGIKYEKIKKDFMKLQSINPHSTVLEFVSTVWYIDGVSRALQQQLTRTRQASYSIQSLRIVPVKSFAKDKAYHVPNTVPNKTKFKHCMQEIESMYKDLLNDGFTTQDARGVLPLNIHSPITMNINLRALANFLSSRLCHLSQGEIQSLGHRMVSEIEEKMGKDVIQIFMPPCERVGYCPMPIFCNKMPYKQHKLYSEIDVYEWLDG